jgi:hypothetical protein
VAARSVHEAVQDFKETVSKAVSCVTHSQLTFSESAYTPPRPNEPVRALMLNYDEPVALRHSARYVALRASLEFRVVHDPAGNRLYKITTAGYRYSLQDERSREYLAFHWHPESRSAATWPHIHVGQATALDPTGVHAVGQQLHTYEVIEVLACEQRFQPSAHRLFASKPQYLAIVELSAVPA